VGFLAFASQNSQSLFGLNRYGRAAVLVAAALIFRARTWR
jgi:hypothetical protein